MSEDTVISVIKETKSMLKGGSTLREALGKLGISYSKWKAICDKEGLKITAPRGKRAIVYTKERVKEVKRRLQKGEFLKDIAHDMGMDPRNLARYCRNNGIKLFSKAVLKDNYRRRDYSNAGRPSGQRQSKKVLKIQGKITAGLKDSEIAVEFGVTRQYANYLRNKMANKTIHPTQKMRG